MAESFVSERVLTNGEAVIIEMKAIPVPRTVYVIPAVGDTITVKYSLDEGVTYTAWTKGACTSYTDDVLTGPVHSLSFQRTAGSGTTSKVGVR